jgi:hypothetical protein
MVEPAVAPESRAKRKLRFNRTPTTLSTNPEFKVSDQDLKFLKSLRIKIDEEKREKDK